MVIRHAGKQRLKQSTWCIRKLSINLQISVSDVRPRHGYMHMCSLLFGPQNQFHSSFDAAMQLL